MIGAGTWEVVHFGFAFYGFATYNVLVNPSNPAALSVLNTMVETGDYFFFALDPTMAQPPSAQKSAGIASPD